MGNVQRNFAKTHIVNTKILQAKICHDTSIIHTMLDIPLGVQLDLREYIYEQLKKLHLDKTLHLKNKYMVYAIWDINTISQHTLSISTPIDDNITSLYIYITRNKYCIHYIKNLYNTHKLP